MCFQQSEKNRIHHIWFSWRNLDYLLLFFEWNEENETSQCDEIRFLTTTITMPGIFFDSREKKGRRPAWWFDDVHSKSVRTPFSSVVSLNIGYGRNNKHNMLYIYIYQHVNVVWIKYDGNAVKQTGNCGRRNKKTEEEKFVFESSYPFRKLCIHHEIVYVLFRSGQFKFTRHNRYQQSCATGTLRKINLFQILICAFITFAAIRPLCRWPFVPTTNPHRLVVSFARNRFYFLSLSFYFFLFFFLQNIRFIFNTFIQRRYVSAFHFLNAIFPFPCAALAEPNNHSIFICHSTLHLVVHSFYLFYLFMSFDVGTVYVFVQFIAL